jgi:hypothetical protein
MKKVQAFKNSKGKLFENEKEYILSEAKIQRTLILENWERLTEIVESDPTLYYDLIKQIGFKIIDDKISKEDLQKQADNATEIFSKEGKIKVDNYKRSGENFDMEPYLWGNDILDGYDVNR